MTDYTPSLLGSTHSVDKPHLPIQDDEKKAFIVGACLLGALLLLLVVGFFLANHHKPVPAASPPRVLHSYTLLKGQSAAMLIGNQSAILVAARNGIPIYRRGLHGTAFTRIDTVGALAANTNYNLLTAKFFPGDRFVERQDGSYDYLPAHPRWRH